MAALLNLGNARGSNASVIATTTRNEQDGGQGNVEQRVESRDETKIFAAISVAMPGTLKDEQDEKSHDKSCENLESHDCDVPAQSPIEPTSRKTRASSEKAEAVNHSENLPQYLGLKTG